MMKLWINVGQQIKFSKNWMKKTSFNYVIGGPTFRSKSIYANITIKFYLKISFYTFLLLQVFLALQSLILVKCILHFFNITWI